jgi:hypothetical protein
MLDLFLMIAVALFCAVMVGVTFVKVRQTVRETRTRVRTLRRLDEIQAPESPHRPTGQISSAVPKRAISPSAMVSTHQK